MVNYHPTNKEIKEMIKLEDMPLKEAITKLLDENRIYTKTDKIRLLESLIKDIKDF